MGQWVESELGVVGLAPPGVLIFRAIVGEKEKPGRWQALDEAIEEGLRLGIDPMQVLKDCQQGLHLTLPQ
jgi:hypothetical protein